MKFLIILCILLYTANISYASKVFLKSNEKSKMINVISAFQNQTNVTSNDTKTSSSIPVPNGKSPIAAAIVSLATSSNQTSNGTNVFQGKTNASDALGIVGDSNNSVTSAPYSVKDCNQILLVDVNRIKSLEDFTSREPGFFTMSIYLANIFQSKDSNKLINSITMDRMIQPPSLIPGAPGCVRFDSDKKNIAICVQSQEIAIQLIQAFRDFQNCRKGQRPLTLEEIIRRLEECERIKSSNLNNNNNSTSGLTPNYTNSTSALGAINTPIPNGMNINPYYMPLKIPGTS